MDIDTIPPVPVLPNGYMLDRLTFRKYQSVYQRITHAKQTFLEPNIFFSRISFRSKEICCNFALAIGGDGCCVVGDGSYGKNAVSPL